MATQTMTHAKSAAAPKPAAPANGKLALGSYTTLSGAKGAHGPHVRVSEPQLKKLLASVLQHVNVDEAWYVRRYPDIGEAIARGDVTSARDHYRKAGYFEDRFPRQIAVDVEWYLAKYPDVGKAVASGAVAGAQEHFERHGFREGRLPSADWSLCD